MHRDNQRKRKTCSRECITSSTYNNLHHVESETRRFPSLHHDLGQEFLFEASPLLLNLDHDFFAFARFQAQPTARSRTAEKKRCMGRLKWNELCSRSLGDKAWEWNASVRKKGGMKQRSLNKFNWFMQVKKEKLDLDRVHFWLHLLLSFSMKAKRKSEKERDVNRTDKKSTLMMAAPAIAPMHCEQM